MRLNINRDIAVLLAQKIYFYVRLYAISFALFNVRLKKVFSF